MTRGWFTISSRDFQHLKIPGNPFLDAGWEVKLSQNFGIEIIPKLGLELSQISEQADHKIPFFLGISTTWELFNGAKPLNFILFSPQNILKLVNKTLLNAKINFWLNTNINEKQTT